MKNLTTTSKWGYCALSADFLHIGHLKYMKRCKEYCEKLYVGIMSDECILDYKKAKPIQTCYEREEVIRGLKIVNGTFIQNTFEFPEFVLRLSKRKGMHVFDSTEHNREGATMVFDRHNGISSTLLKKAHDESTDYSKCPL